MIMLTGDLYQVPLFSLITTKPAAVDSTIAGVFGGDVNGLANKFVIDSLSSPATLGDITVGKLKLRSGGIPFYADSIIVDIVSKVSTPGTVDVVINGKTHRRTVDKATAAVVKPTILCAYLLASCQVKHIEEKARLEGVGLGTKELFQLNRAKADRDRLGSMKMLWYNATETPIILDSHGIKVRANATYAPWNPSVQQLNEVGSGLLAQINSHKASLSSYYKELYPSATSTVINDALADSGILDWYDQKFAVYNVPRSVNQIVSKPPLLLKLESLPASEMSDLAGKYLLATVPKALSSSELGGYYTEYFTALRRKGHGITKSKLVEGREVLRHAMNKLTGYDGDHDLVQAITGSQRWAEFTRTSLIPGVTCHPMLWTSVSFSGNTLSGLNDAGTSVSVDVPGYLSSFCSLLADSKTTLVHLLAGWEHFIASTHAASFKDYYGTVNTYKIKSLRPMLSSCGITGSMMKTDIIGIIS